MTYWESWNQPNVSYFDQETPRRYVTVVLVPFAWPAHAAESRAKLVGGSTRGFDRGWWSGFGQAGGFRAIDVVAVHPYAEAQSWEQSGVIGDLQQLCGPGDVDAAHRNGGASLGWLGAHGVGVHGAHVVGRGNRVTAVWTADVTWRIPLPSGHHVLNQTGAP